MISSFDADITGRNFLRRLLLRPPSKVYLTPVKCLVYPAVFDVPSTGVDGTCGCHRAKSTRGKAIGKPSAADEGSADTIVAAFEARLASLEQEIARLSSFASKTKDLAQQDEYWRLAQEWQREARKVRSQIRSHSC